MKEITNNGTLDRETIHFKVFISMPYDSDTEPKKYWAYFYQKAIYPIKAMLESRSSFHIDFIYKKKDRKPGEIPTLVAESIDGADVLLCVLTDFKPNVMYEVGYARKMGMPIVFLLDQRSLDKPLPILIGRPQTYYYDGANEDAFETIPNELVEFLRSACWEAQGKRSQIRERHTPIFNATCYQTRDYVNLPDLIRRASSEIEILTTNLDYFAAPSKETVQHPLRIMDLKNAIDKGVRIRFYTMDPDSNIVVERNKLLEPVAEGRDVFQYRKALIRNIKTLYIYFQEAVRQGNCSIGLYDALPTLMIYRIDDRYIIPSVSLIKKSRLCIHVEFKRMDPGVRDTFELTLDQIRRIAKPVQQFSWINEDWPQPYEIVGLKK